MAGFALGRDMPPPERVFGVQVMIERNGSPIGLRVAGLAFLSVAAFVLVIFLVARIALERRIFEGGGEVALLTLDLGMLSHQWEARLIVVEWRFLP